MNIYNWQKKDWPNFIYAENEVENELSAITEKSGIVSGMLKAIPEKMQMETLIDMVISEAIKTSAIEGEFLSRDDVKSSVIKNLGLSSDLPIKDKLAKGLGALMIRMRNTFNEHLTSKELFTWHGLLMNYKADIASGKWRTGNEPMQVISGRPGKVKIHFEAPPAGKVPGEMKKIHQLV